MDPERTPWLTILCKFRESNEPAPPKLAGPADFEVRLRDEFPGLDHYWRQVSGDRITLAGSRVVGWYTLPKTHEDYVREGGVDFDRLLDDAVARAVENDGVEVFSFSGLLLMFLGDLAGSNWGQRRPVRRGDRERVMGVAWLPVSAFLSLHDVAHEMGHGYGLEHSEGPNFDVTLDPSPWDVMSAGAFKAALAPFERLDVHPIAYYKSLKGWIDEERIFTFTGGVQRVSLERSALPSTDNPLMARIPIDGSDDWFYTLEARRKAGYDEGVPGEGIVIHEVRLGRPVFTFVDGDPPRPRDIGPGPAWLVANPETEAGEWTPDARSNLFYDKQHRIGVMVRGDTPSATGYEVGIWVGPPAPSRMRVGKRTATSIELRWEGQFPAGTKFGGAIRPVGSEEFAAVDLGGGPSGGVFSGLQPGTTYEFAVKAADGDGASDFTPRLRARTAQG